ncbi:MAG: alpha/beta hydrolase [Lachnospiraceae bacterium]|nr:alpha/beta hydrolase [Lachnospiraceae bacterium]
MSPLMKAVKSIHSVSSSGDSIDLEDIKKQRSSQDLFGSISTLSKDIVVQELSPRGIPAEWVFPEFKHDKDRVVFYCHGGGYTCGSLKYARVIASKLAVHTGIPVMSFEYSLAPEHPYPAALEDALVIWNYIMQLGFGAREVIVVGDSAGGNLALELILKLKSQKRIPPKGLVLMSPWTDMTMSGETYETCKDIDPLLTKEYIQTCRYSFVGLNEKYNEEETKIKIDEADLDYANPDFSPLFADLEGFPPTLIQVGSNEILKSDSIRLYEKLLSLGVPAVLEEYDDAWHVFQMMPLKKAVIAMDSIGRFVDGLF